LTSRQQFHVAREFACGLIAIFRVLREGARDELRAQRREVGLEGQDAWHGFGDVRDGHAHRRVGFVGEAVSEQLEDDDAERVCVAAAVERFDAARLLGTHVRGRAHDARAAEGARALHHLRDAEVGEEGVAARVEEDVARLEIAVDDAARVRLVERLGHAADDAADLGEAERAARHAVEERAARHVAHHDERLFLVLAVVVDGDDVGVFERSDDLGFALEARAELLVEGELARQDFDRDLPLHVRVAREVDDRHPAPAQLAFNFITTDGLWGGHEVLSPHTRITPSAPPEASRWPSELKATLFTSAG
jgi:hypothetical protein